jgi:cob(I)alamin adenosyltransferase
MATYTKKGDRGKTGLFRKVSVKNNQIPKDSLRIEAIGVIDEVNSFLGMIASGPSSQLAITLREVQEDLFIISSILAGARLRFYRTKAKRLEGQIDRIEKELAPLKNFIFPGGAREAAQLHYARSLTRRAERVVVSLDRKEKVKPQILAYLNRLSDFLFVLAREVNNKQGVKEELWTGKR